jgi:hypothetical protein
MGGTSPVFAAALGGRLMVRLQTLDLRIGVRVPASQPKSTSGTNSSAERGTDHSVHGHSGRWNQPADGGDRAVSPPFS